MRRGVLMLAVMAVLALGSGCGIGPGEERGGDGAKLRITRDFGRDVVSQRSEPKVRTGQTVMRLLRDQNRVKTRYGGGFVQSIDGLAGGGAGGTRDWFFFVNGILADRGADEYELSPGDTVQWDYRDWRGAQDVRAIVGAFPEPFVNGLDGKGLPTRVECADASADPCDQVKQRLRDAGVPATGSSLGASGTTNVARVVVAPWDRARELPSARLLEGEAKESGVFARFRDEGSRLDLLGPDGETVRRAGAGTGLIAATRPGEDQLLWLVTGTDEAGVERAADRLDPATLRDAFAVAVEPEGPADLPLAEGD